MKRLNISVLNNLICLSENDQYLQVGVLLKYIFIHGMNLRVYGRPANDTFHRLLLVESMGLCEKECSSEAISWIFLAISASCFRICSSLDRINYILHENSYISISLTWRINELNEETSVWLTLVFLCTTKLGIRDSHAIKLMANLTERNGFVLSCERVMSCLSCSR